MVFTRSFSSVCHTDWPSSPVALCPFLLLCLSSESSLSCEPFLALSTYQIPAYFAHRSYSIPWPPGNLGFHRRHEKGMRMTREMSYSHCNCLGHWLSVCGQLITNKTIHKCFLKCRFQGFFPDVLLGWGRMSEFSTNFLN